MLFSAETVLSLICIYRKRVGQLVGSIRNRDVIFLTHDATLYTAMKFFNVKGIEEILVVDGKDNKWEVGILKRRNGITIYIREILNLGGSEKA